jgi:hypothetical protein
MTAISEDFPSPRVLGDSEDFHSPRVLDNRIALRAESPNVDGTSHRWNFKFLNIFQYSRTCL